MNDAQEAIELAGDKVRSETHEGGRLLFSDPSSRSAAPGPRRKPGAVLLPPWDEYVIAYKDRAAVLGPRIAPDSPGQAVGSSPIVIDGRARGSWRRSLRGATVRVSVNFWTSVTRDERRAVEAAADLYGRFLGLGVQIV
jgi:hypothetical protein